jgi:serralysin
MATILETIDAPSGVTTPYVLGAGDQFFGTMLQNGSDWVAVTLVAGRSYCFGAVGLGVTDPFLRLYGPSGAMLTQDDDGGPGFSAQIRHTATVSGLVYLEARALAGSGGYGLVVAEGNLPSYDDGMAAAILAREGDVWAPDTGGTIALTWGVRAAGSALDATGASAPFVALTTAQIAATRAALANYAEVGGVRFQQVAEGGTTTAATLLLGGYSSATDGVGAYAYAPGSRVAADTAGDVWINAHWVSGTSLPMGSYGQFILLHELGHALGLAHPSDYEAVPGGSVTYAGAAQYLQDSQQYTVMSYFPAMATEGAAPVTYPDTLMMHDILAFQHLYGANTATRAGNDVYGFGGVLGGAFDFTVNRDPLLCIWDGGGRDTLNLSGFGGAQGIDLNDGAFSDVGGFRGNLSIAVGVVIENAVGGAGTDRLQGNAAANWLRGGASADQIAGGRGHDVLAGNLGADRFIFGLGDGRDRIADYGVGRDRLQLSSDLWGGAVMTADAVLAEFGLIRRGVVVLDFGLDEVTLTGHAQLAGLAESLSTI